jgi:hypothetical protein
MKFTDRQNRIEKEFLKNSRLTMTLPLGGKIQQGKVVLKGSVTIANGNANGTLVGEGGPINLIKRVIVRANPAPGSRYLGGKVVDCTPRSLLRYAMLQRGKFLGDLGASALGSGAAGTYDVYLSIPIYFQDTNFRRASATSLNADPAAYQSIQVELETGDLTSCFTGNDRDLDVSGLKVHWVDDRQDLAGDSFVLFQEDHTTLIPGAQKRFQDGSMPSDGAFLQWLIMTETNAPTVQTLADTILEKVELNGQKTDYMFFPEDLRQKMYDDAWVDVDQTLTGIYLADFCDGLISNFEPASTLISKFDVKAPSGANLDGLHIYTRRLFAPQNMKL